jgi:hypothetical protein
VITRDVARWRYRICTILILLVNFGEDFSFNHGVEGSSPSALTKRKQGLRSDFAPPKHLSKTARVRNMSANQLRAGALRPTENDFAMLRPILLALLLQLGGILLMFGRGIHTSHA